MTTTAPETPAAPATRPVAPLERLGADVRGHREAIGATLRELARCLGVSPGYVSDIEHGRRAPSPATLGALAVELRCTDVTRRRWSALCGRLPDALTRALLAHPEKWDAVLNLLAKETDNG